jgi:small subunit ribosomal protein S23
MSKQKAFFSPLSIANATKMYRDGGFMKVEPVWYPAVVNTPPMTDFSRKPARTNEPRAWNRPADIRKMRQMNTGLGNSIRKKFYTEHPWELARPKVVVEEDGADYVRQDWSKMEQIAKPLDGER